MGDAGAALPIYLDAGRLFAGAGEREHRVRLFARPPFRFGHRSERRRVRTHTLTSGITFAEPPRHLFGTLSEALPDARRSLNRMAEEFVFLGD